MSQTVHLVLPFECCPSISVYIFHKTHCGIPVYCVISRQIAVTSPRLFFGLELRLSGILWICWILNNYLLFFLPCFLYSLRPRVTVTTHWVTLVGTCTGLHYCIMIWGLCGSLAVITCDRFVRSGKLTLSRLVYLISDLIFQFFHSYMEKSSKFSLEKWSPDIFLQHKNEELNVLILVCCFCEIQTRLLIRMSTLEILDYEWYVSNVP